MELPVQTVLLAKWNDKEKRINKTIGCNFATGTMTHSSGQTNQLEPLIENNTPDPEPSAFPDIPREMPGVILESNIPSLETPLQPTEKEWLAAAMANAGLEDEFEQVRYMG